MPIVPITLTAKTEAEQSEIVKAVASNNGLPETAAGVKQFLREKLQEQVNLYNERQAPKPPLGIE